MKHDVLDFIDSNTLREMLRSKEIAPAVECILIAKSRKQSLKTKLECIPAAEHSVRNMSGFLMLNLWIRDPCPFRRDH